MKVGGTSMNDILMNLMIAGVPSVIIVDFNGWHNRKIFNTIPNDDIFREW